MKASYLITILAYNLAITSLYSADGFIASTRNFPKFDELPYKYNDSSKTQAVIPTEFLQRVHKPQTILQIFPPILVHLCTKYADDCHTKNFLALTIAFDYNLAKVHHIEASARVLCMKPEISPQTADHAVQACAHILHGHAIDLTDSRLAIDENRELCHKRALIGYLPSLLQNIILSDEAKYTFLSYYGLLDSVFRAVYKNQDAVSYDLNVIQKIIQKHNESVISTPNAQLWLISPQTTLGIAQDYEKLMKFKQCSPEHTYDKHEELANFQQLISLFPQELNATTDNITNENYLNLAFEGYAITHPNYSKALTGWRDTWFGNADDTKIRSCIRKILIAVNFTHPRGIFEVENIGDSFITAFVHQRKD